MWFIFVVIMCAALATLGLAVILVIGIIAMIVGIFTVIYEQIFRKKKNKQKIPQSQYSSRR